LTKKKFSVVRDTQKKIEEEFSGASRVSLKPIVWKHMEMLFKSQKDLCDTLETTPKTWRDVKSAEGVREGTARRLVLEFISLVHKVAEKETDAPKEIFDTVVPRLDQIYAPYLMSLDLDDLYSHRDNAAPAAQQGENG
jgi:hypothetical protein